MNDWKTKLQEQLFFGEALVLISEGYFELCISSYLAVTDPHKTIMFSVVLGFLGCGFVIAIPLILLYIIL